MLEVSTMRKWSLILLLGMFFVFPGFVFAQSNLTLINVSVQLWPEYDQPSMLVITDFEVPVTTTLPVDLTFRIPKDAHLIAVASYTADGSLANAVFEGPKDDGEWQVFTITLDSTAARFEYYQPITFNGKQRIFSYLWDGEYAVDVFDIQVLEPADTTSLTTTPKLASIEQKDGLKYFHGDPVKLANGEQFALNLEYQKSSDALITSAPGVQPAAPVDENTPGRVSLNNTLPYLIGGLGVIMIVGGLVYYLRSGNAGLKKSRRRQHANANAEESESDVYCAQCGTRAHNGDRFCRTCGARLRHKEE
jgi:hypothetical protein